MIFALLHISAKPSEEKCLIADCHVDHLKYVKDNSIIKDISEWWVRGEGGEKIHTGYRKERDHERTEI